MFSLRGAERTDVDHTSQRGGHARFHSKLLLSGRTRPTRPLTQHRNSTGTIPGLIENSHKLENDGETGRLEDYRAIPPFNPDLIVMTFIILLFG